MNRLSALAASLLLIATGLLHGWWTDRWSASPAIVDMVRKLDTVSSTLGPWQARTLPLDAAEMAQAGYAGASWRLYKNEQSGSAISVLLVCGRPGRVSVHTPEVCYPGAGFSMLGEPRRTTFRSGTSSPCEFLNARFGVKKAGVEERLQVYWAWSGDGTWTAPENPRRAFAALPVLLKLYAVREVPMDDRDISGEMNEFMNRLLPELDRLFVAQSANDRKS
jgi:hypothetical protein